MTFQVFHKTGLLFFQIGFHKWPEYELFHRYDFSEFRFSPILFHAVSRPNAHACSHYRYRTPSDMGFPRMLLRSMYETVLSIFNESDIIKNPNSGYIASPLGIDFDISDGIPDSIDIIRKDFFDCRFRHISPEEIVCERILSLGTCFGI